MAEPANLVQDKETTDSTASRYKKICVVGLGYVGLPTALLFARKGYSVYGADINPKLIDTLNQGNIEDVNPELTDWWRDIEGSNNFKASTEAVEADAFLIAVPTPVHGESKTCDLTAVTSATQSVAKVLKRGDLVVLESTVPPGTTLKTVKNILEKTGLKAGEDFDLCFCPERILPGNTISELVNNHRVLGGINKESTIRAKALLETVIDGEIFITDATSAEFCKLAENTYRDVNIALANELSIIADEHDINLKELIPLINKHPRVNLLQPGIGVGGHCIAVDPWFFVEVSPWKTELISTSRRVNDRMPAYRAQQIMDNLTGIEKPKVCLVGLTYKPNVADTRESPALRIVSILKEKDIDVITYDPLLEEYADTTLYDAVKDADYLGILVGHDVIKAELKLNRDSIEQLMRRPVIQIF